MKPTSPSLFIIQDKYKQTKVSPQAVAPTMIGNTKLLTAQLFLSIIRARYSLSLRQLYRNHPNGVKEVCKALHRLTGGFNARRVKDNARKLLSEVLVQPISY